ncbi:GtrA family protein [Listeria costaricensis]|uniref:GtrA family protein n=1 Tax=Listeria costaricensis TaxID=2026604 RepID=UPI001F099F67|nr:GtrA family protein [Listeria costaricensis]
MLKNKLSKELIMYVIMGVLTTVVNLIVFYLLISTGADYKVAVVVAWILSVLFAYITNKKYVFENKTSTMKAFLWEMGSFFFFRLLSLGLNMIVMIVMVDQMHLGEMFSQIVANVLIIIFNYVASKLVIFRKTGNQ